MLEASVFDNSGVPKILQHCCLLPARHMSIMKDALDRKRILVYLDAFVYSRIGMESRKANDDVRILAD